MAEPLSAADALAVPGAEGAVNRWRILYGAVLLLLGALNVVDADRDDADFAHGFAAAAGLLWGVEAVVVGVRRGRS